MFGIGGFELFIILLFGFLIFGPEKLPDIARTIGRAIAKFRDAQAEMNETLKNNKVYDPDNPDGPFGDPIQTLESLAKVQEDVMSGVDELAGAGSSSAPVAAAATTAAAAASNEPHRETFSERKARYERERAARKAAAEAEAAAAAEAEAATAAEAAAAEAEAEAAAEDIIEVESEPAAETAAEVVEEAAEPAVEVVEAAEPVAEIIEEASVPATEGGE